MALSDEYRVLLCGYGPAGALALSVLRGDLRLSPQNLLCATYDTPANRDLLRELSLASIPTLFDDIGSAPVVQRVAEFAPDIVLSMHYPKRVPSQILDISRVGGINLHPSLLPRYRGCFSVLWVLINGEPETGISFHFMTDRFDEGAIVLQQRAPILDSDTGYSLFHRLMQLGLDLLAPAMTEALEHPERAQVQTGTPSYFPRALPFGGVIDPAWPDPMIERFIRAMTFPPKPGAKVRLGRQLVEVRSWSEFESLRGEHSELRKDGCGS